MRLRPVVLWLALFAGVVSAWAFTPEDTSHGIVDPAFKSLQLRVNGDQLSVPVIALDSGDRIEIVFDELADDRRYMRYELIHCDARWQPENLVDSEFLDGFNVADVDDYDFSRATLMHYVNYRITLPNDQMRFTASGNYVVRVYPEDDPDATILRARFSVSEATMGLSGDVTTRTDIDTNGRHQQVELTVDTRDSGVENIYDDLIVTVTQNGRPETEVIVGHPLRVQGSKAVYEHVRPLIFPAGNEWRRFEIVSTRYPGRGVEAIEYHDPLYHFVLAADEPRAADRYRYDQTQHGRFYIREYDSADSDTEADYAVVHMSLRMPMLRGAEVYVDGEMTGHRLDPSSHMIYNSATGAYELSMLLKQGAYNYQYVVVTDGGKADAGRLEGNFHETSNEYLVKVYHRPRGTRYDRLVGAAVIMSTP